jgi:hypothetical protein
MPDRLMDASQPRVPGRCTGIDGHRANRMKYRRVTLRQNRFAFQNRFNLRKAGKQEILLMYRERSHTAQKYDQRDKTDETFDTNRKRQALPSGSQWFVWAWVDVREANRYLETWVLLGPEPWCVR